LLLAKLSKALLSLAARKRRGGEKEGLLHSFFMISLLLSTDAFYSGPHGNLLFLGATLSRCLCVVAYQHGEAKKAPVKVMKFA
jgi:hypothetical protein